MSLLENHIVLITGAGSGLGLGIARYCKAQGAAVIVTDISSEKIQQLASEFSDNDLALICDVTKIADLEHCQQQILQKYGRLDAVIGAQGIFDGNVAIKNMTAAHLDQLFDELFHVNVKGYLLTAHIFADVLKANKGAMVFTTSTAAYAADGGGAVYTATKGAIRSLIQQLAFEFAPEIRVNGVAPAAIGNSQLKGPKALNLDHQKQSDIPKDAFLNLFQSISLLQELPDAEDYGALYAFLASKQNKVMTGQTIVADQGLLNRAVLTH
ncbi:SDR family oxidoreductase [Acinetobacter sp. SA01]|uniref:SDR family oxidoreductase n=1 Tax=Acinetobacter sp. SA01 TaxID=1862567 RepID=UPI00140E52BB|nr:SDR family oxidoreductase [Acinetobacter sp. SA01]